MIMHPLLQEANASSLSAFAHIRKLQSQNQMAEALLAIQSQHLQKLTYQNERLLRISLQFEQDRKTLSEIRSIRECDPPKESSSFGNSRSTYPSHLAVHKIPDSPAASPSPNIHIQIPDLEWVVQYLSEITSQGIKQAVSCKAEGEQQLQQQRVILQKYKRRLSELNSKHVSLIEQFRKSQKSSPQYM